MRLRSYPQSRISRGFTLLELLVVIAIVAILAALTYGGYQRTIALARATESISNLRQIGVAFTLYTSDFRKYPAAWNKQEGRTYAQYLDPYIYEGREERTRDNIFISPCAHLPVQVEQWSHPITYSANPAICIDATTNSDGVPLQNPVYTTQVKRPTQTILLIDGCQIPGNNGQSRANFYAVEEVWENPTGMDVPIKVGPDSDEDSSAGHIRYTANGMAQALMADGSARRFKKGKITKGNVNIGR